MSGLGCVPALDTADNKLYCGSSQRINVYDCHAESVTARIAVQDDPVAVAWSATANKVYVSFDNYWSGVMVIDCRTDSVLKFIPISGGAQELCMRGTGDKVYFGGDHLLGVIDVATDSLVHVIHLPDSPTWLALNPVMDRLIIQDWWDGTFVLDCAGDTMVDSLPYNVARFGGLDVRTNRLYLFLSFDALCTIDMETGLVLDTLMTGHVSSMALDTSDNKAYVLMDEYPYYNDTVWVVDADSGGVLRTLQTQEYTTCRAIWNPLMNKVYVGADVPPPGVEDIPSAEARIANGGPTILSHLPPGAVAFDAMGRRVTRARAGVYFIAVGGERSAVSVRRVVIQH